MQYTPNEESALPGRELFSFAPGEPTWYTVDDVVMGGVSRRAWARNQHAIETIETFNSNNPHMSVTLPEPIDLLDLKEKINAYKKGMTS